jgi:hypothetical protein
MKKLCGLLILMLLGVSSTSVADELLLTNGDLISGTIVSLNVNSVVIETTTLGRLSIERSKVKKGVFYGTESQTAPPLSDAPTDAIILTQWKDTVNQNTCKDFVNFTSVRIVEKKIMGNNRVAVRLEVKGDWFGGFMEFAKGPCAGFLSSRGKDQIVDKILTYRKTGDGWFFESLR